MLRLVYGGAGCGKTVYARELACNTVKDGGRAIMIVPEQFSFETERSMLGLLGAQEARKVKVYSFTRLAEEVSRISNSASGRRLDDCGRVAAMGAALSQLGGQLDYYGGKQPSVIFIDHLLDAVKEFKLCAITPDMLAETAKQANGTLHKKLSELAIIFSAYEAIVAQTSLDPMDDFTRLYSQLGEQCFFEGATVIIDSFRGFTGQELKVISRIIAQAKDCIITVCSETAERIGNNGLFETSLKTADRLKALAAENGVSVAPSVLLAARHRFTSPALEAVESGIFRYGEGREVYAEPTEDVVIYEADNRYSEMEFCARECRRLMREENFRCRDIAIIARSEAEYSALAYDSLTLQDIPCFLDRRTDASSCALMQFVLTALDIVCRGWQCDDLLRWLKTGLVSETDTSIVSEIENYCFVWSLSGRDWRRPFTQPLGGFGASVSEAEQQRLDKINAVRERTVALLEKFSSALDDANGRQMAQALFSLLEESGVPKRLDELCGRLDVKYADEQAQLWDSLMSILDQIASILGAGKLTRDNFAAYITLMINRCDIGKIPHGLDDVVFGGADRMRVSAPRAVFIVGAVEGEFPAAQTGSGVFTDEERKRLHDEMKLPVAEAAEHQMLEERLMAYSALSAASERLYITYPKKADGSSTAYPSECISEVLQYVPQAKRVYSSDSFSIEDIEAPGAAFEIAACHWKASGEVSALVEELKKNGEFAARLKVVEASAKNDPPALSGGHAAALFGDNMHISPSQAEKFHHCRFSYFCQYGVRLQSRNRAALDTLQYGSIVHYVLEHFLGSTEAEQLVRLSESRDDVENRIAQLLEEYLNTEMGGGEDKKDSMLYQLRQMKYSLTELVLNISSEFSVSDFRPVAYEMKIDRGGEIEPSYIRLENDRSLNIKGTVDRVDCWQDNGKTYIRVIDYKTGTKSFTLSDVVEGLNMQMLIYAGELCREDNGRFVSAVPAGILYCPANSGFASVDRNISAEKLKDKHSSSLKRNGLIVDGSTDTFVCNAMENGVGGRYIPVKLKRDGTPDNASGKNLITPADYEIVERYVRYKLAVMGNELARGNISPDPVRESYDVCQSCDYYDICRYDGEQREKYKGSNEETLMTMKQIMNGEGNENGQR